MDNGKTSVLALFPASKLENPSIWKRQSLFACQCAHKKNAILSLTPTFNALTLTLILTQT